MIILLKNSNFMTTILFHEKLINKALQNSISIILKLFFFLIVNKTPPSASIKIDIKSHPIYTIRR